VQSSNQDSLVRISVRIELVDGAKLDLSLISPRALLKMHEVMNREDQFIDVESLSGERFVIAKTAIKMVKPRDIPQLKELGTRIEDKTGFDPYRVLGVKEGDPKEAVHLAYQAMIREYHPDRFAAVQLPKEVNEYVAAMARRVNAAYEMISNAA
jgi:DnaJ-domain-containing protein 1